jgi:hypothetical protein
MRLIVLLLLSACGLNAAAAGGAADAVTVVEDWSRTAPGSTGVPAGWREYATPGGRPRYDFAVVHEDGVRALRLKSRDEHSTIAKEVQVDLRATPILEWTWKAVTLPDGADIRRRQASDLTAYVLVVWPRPPAILRTRLIGYVWDGVVPAGAMERSRKSGLVTFFVVRSGSADLGRFVSERRNVYDDYIRAFGEPPPNPSAVAISIDTNDTSSTAEALIGRIAFVPAPTGR